MASRFLARSGIACGLVADVLKWQPRSIYQVGVGIEHKEVEVLSATWPGVPWYGCEPHPSSCAAARESYPGELIQTAIGATPGRALLYNKRRHQNGASLFVHNVGQDEEVTTHDVAVNTLDALFVCKAPPALLWLDCEGSELNALKGGEGLLRHVEMINVELTAKPNIGECPAPWVVHNYLAERGFFLQWIHTQRITAGQCDYVYVRRRLFSAAYCCVPHEVERFINAAQ